MEPIIIQNFINGEFYPTEEYIDSVDPATLEVVSKGEFLVEIIYQRDNSSKVKSSRSR
jgi:hypothetical protein